MVFKYAVDATVIGLVTGQVWTPLDYLVPSLFLREPKLKAMPFGLMVALGLWSLPFVWIGVSMTLRRLLDAGRSPWLALLFFVPPANYVCRARAPGPPGARKTWR